MKQLLIAALEKVVEDEIKPGLALHSSERDALYHVRSLIEADVEEPLTHSALAQRAGLNEWLLKNGFKLLFGYSPYQYHVQLKMERAKVLL